ncbi:GAF domain-containing protein [Streptomyces rectiverticillatus]|uniref:GAF domain-containing sensor histidine kinase n=1 Tax=Streptomyces rectiverticillatus TaxID=173860 RepID=UPI0015C3BCAA|nr:GAF domain-containing protein [Streptomyces rectiverticillatus]QLE75461.1 GAF domain-containing protein [Streptomyces rectiverticillatus]
METTGGGSVRLPHLRLDELLGELQARLDTARGTWDRVHSLLEAVLSVGRELDLEHVLRRIVEAAVVLVDARYGALGVIGQDGRTLSQFLTVGLTDEQIKAIGPFPSGHGLLGELIRHPAPLRLPKISEHAASYGFPSGHPPMHSFVGVPISVRDQVFGNLYLTEKRGGADFDAEDEAVLSTLAVAAGVAVDNARLYEESTRRERWLRASARVTTSLMSGSPRQDVMAQIAELAKEITEAELATVSLPLDDGSALTVEVATGELADAIRGVVLPVEGSLVGVVLSEREPVCSLSVDEDPRVSAVPKSLTGLGPAVAVPVKSGETVIGVLFLARGTGRPVFSQEEIEPLLNFAGQAAMAMELAQRRADAEQLTLLEDRDRIARDLHDLAIQRLFATGMTLQSADRFIDHAEASERVQRAVNDLDETIKIIRATIFGLRSRETAPRHGLRTRVVQTVGGAAALLGFAPSLRMEGLLDTRVPRAVIDDAVAVLEEALTNVVRHARATSIGVCVVNDGRDLVLTVTDDGVGMPGEGRRSGLRNLAERAERHGGQLLLSAPSGDGTVLTWRVPLPAEQPRTGP